MSEKREFRIGDAVRIIGDGCNFTEHLDGEVGIIINTGFSSNNWMVQVGDCTWFIYDDHMKPIKHEHKEVTFIHTVELTAIYKLNDDEEIRDSEEIKRGLEMFLKECLDLDDVKVIKAQVFERDLTNED